MKIFITLLLFSLVTASVHAAPKWFTAPELKSAPDLEKGLEDPAWTKALKIPFVKLNDGSGETKTYPSESYWFYAEGSLYLGFKCINPASPKLWEFGRQPRDNYRIFQCENLEIFIGDMTADLYYQFVIDAAGSQFDGKRTDKLWNGEQTYRVHRQDGSWTVVLKIPPYLLATIWRSGSFITIDVARNSYNADGSVCETTAISPPGHHSPEDRVFLGRISTAYLGELQDKAINNFRRENKTATLPQSVAERLKGLDAFAAQCRKKENASLTEFQGFYRQYIENLKSLTKLQRDLVLGFIFESER